MFLSDAGGVGLNLQRAANACINLELPWNPAVLEQRIGRIYRLGQEDPIDVINLVTEYGIEARIANLVGNKQALFSGLFDGTTDSVRFDGPASFIGDLERLVEPVELPDIEASDDEMPEPASTHEPAASNELQGSSDEPPPASGESSRADSIASPESSAPESSGPESALPRSRQVATLFASIAVSRTPEGGVRIEAPPAAAAELSQLLVGLAGLLQAAQTPPE